MAVNTINRIARHATLADIAAMVRDDITFARMFATPGQAGELSERNPIRDAPEQITYTVEAPYDASIVITIHDIPESWAVSPQLQALAEELADLMNGYNHDGDRIGKRFFGKVRAGDVTLVW
ncbi:hypothetical protein [Nocardia crassostreae]|uniref:hypothetical protein n=1 Tax=Nocardia crassostreae TaxID=53428 RepID=UPI0008370880|nr:hypothetical protein [Nocardia crassostreae]